LYLVRRQLSKNNLSEKEASLLAWERKLEETQKRHFDRQELLNEREDRINEKEWAWNKKQEELEEMRRQTEAMSNCAKAKEEDVDKRLQALSEKEEVCFFYILFFCKVSNCNTVSTCMQIFLVH
jgi:hypothetical protein